MIQSGIDIMHLKEMMGHSRLKTLSHYVNLVNKDVKQEHQRCHPRG